MHKDLEQGPNGDLWSILLQLIDERSGVTDVIKFKSHLEDVGPSVITQNKIGFHHMLANSCGRRGGRRGGKTIAT